MSKPIKNEFTSKDFRKKYHSEDACLDELFRRTYGQTKSCGKCKSTLGFVRVKGRKAYQCRKCYFQVYPLRGTVFEHTKIPLIDWFTIVFHFTASKNGIACHEVTRLIGVSPQTALRMLRKIREYIHNDRSLLQGEIEADECMVGGLQANRHKDKRMKGTGGRSTVDKSLVFGLIQRGGRVIADILPNASAAVIQAYIRQFAKQGSDLYTDEFKSYNGLDKYYEHEQCNHKKKMYAVGNASTNRMENFWSILKRTIKGAYIKVSRKYLPLYIKEVVFRFNNRHDSNLFDRLLWCMTPSSPLTI